MATQFTDDWCRRRGCGHNSIVHDNLTGNCRGVHVTGIPNTIDADEASCECWKFSPVKAEIVEIEVERVHGAVKS